MVATTRTIRWVKFYAVITLNVLLLLLRPVSLSPIQREPQKASSSSAKELAARPNECLICQYVVRHVQLFQTMEESEVCNDFAEEEGQLQDKCLEYASEANHQRPVDSLSFCTSMGTCRNGEQVDITTYSTEIQATVDRRIHHLYHIGLQVDNEEFSITDEALEVDSTTYETTWDRFVAWIRGEEPTFDMESALDIFEDYASALEQWRIQEEEQMPDNMDATSMTVSQRQKELSSGEGATVQQLEQAFVWVVKESALAVFLRVLLKVLLVLAAILIPVTLWSLVFGKYDDYEEEEDDLLVEYEPDAKPSVRPTSEKLANLHAQADECQPLLVVVHPSI